ncbi:lipid II-degrading bacteriocin, partial [Escherichia coli]|nr:lipid II-degrading bacteriocin [Escherichia coli]
DRRRHKRRTGAGAGSAGDSRQSGRGSGAGLDTDPSGRGIIGESLTRLGAMFSGKEYQILLPGEIHIKESGKR